MNKSLFDVHEYFKKHVWTMLFNIQHIEAGPTEHYNIYRCDCGCYGCNENGLISPLLSSTRSSFVCRIASALPAMYKREFGLYINSIGPLTYPLLKQDRVDYKAIWLVKYPIPDTKLPAE